MVDTTEANVTIGRRLRRIRLWRRKSQTVVAGLAGISESYLSLLETGKRALNRRSLIVVPAPLWDGPCADPRPTVTPIAWAT